MTEFLTWWHSPTTLVFLIGSAGLLVWWRATNMRISFTWEAKTTGDDSAVKALRKESAERAEAIEFLQKEVERLRKP